MKKFPYIFAVVIVLLVVASSVSTAWYKHKEATFWRLQAEVYQLNFQVAHADRMKLAEQQIEVLVECNKIAIERNDLMRAIKDVAEKRRRGRSR